MTASPPPLAADLEAGLRRLKLSRIRSLAPELLLTAKTQRWAPEELLRTLVEAEIAARDESNRACRLKEAAFPVSKTLEGFRPGPLLHPQGHLRLSGQPGVGERQGEPLPGRASRNGEVPSALGSRPFLGRNWTEGSLLHRR